MVLAGTGSISGADFDAVKLRRAQTLLLPAALDTARLRAKTGTTWLEISFPAASG
jgi:hypothetical protein